MNVILHVDRAGRVVLPKAVRNRFHLGAGSALHLRVEPDAIVLEPEQVTAPLVQQGALLVHRGVATGDMLAALESDRDRRIEQVHGLRE